MSATRGTGVVAIRGAGEMATGVAVVLHRAGLARIVLFETPWPLAVRRRVTFSEAVFLGETEVESIRCRRIDHPQECEAAWSRKEIPLLVDPTLEHLPEISPAVLVEATLRKQPLDFRIDLAPVTIALGPGFAAGRDTRAVVETQRGADLGRVILDGGAESDTGLPAPVLGFSEERVVKMPTGGIFRTSREIGELVAAGEPLGTIEVPGGARRSVPAGVGGLIRGLLRDGSAVGPGEKIGDIDPRGDPRLLDRVSEKALRIGAGVREAISLLAPGLLEG